MPISEMRNLWPQINVSQIKSPSWIIRVQATNLRVSTEGLLEGEVSEIDTSDRNLVRLGFNIVAPHLDRYRYELFRIQYGRDCPYPVTLTTENRYELYAVMHQIGIADVESDNEDPGAEFIAHTQKAFEKLLEALFSMRETQGVVESLLALTNDRQVAVTSDSNE